MMNDPFSPYSKGSIDKPHIFKNGKMWVCSAADCQAGAWIDRTPALAYQNWLRYCKPVDTADQQR